MTTFLGYVDRGPMNTLVAVAIAILKACLIAAFFMHALYESNRVRVVIVAGSIWFLNSHLSDWSRLSMPWLAATVPPHESLPPALLSARL